MCVCPLPSKPTRHTEYTKNNWPYFWGRDQATRVLKLSFVTEIQTQATVQRTALDPAFPWTPMHPPEAIPRGGKGVPPVSLAAIHVFSSRCHSHPYHPPRPRVPRSFRVQFPGGLWWPRALATSLSPKITSGKGYGSEKVIQAHHLRDGE